VIGGRTSQGKSALALQIAKDVAKNGQTVLFFSLEMSEESIMKRIFCNTSLIANTDLQENYQDYEKKFIQFRDDFLRDFPLVITYNVGATIDDLYQAINDLPHPDVVIVDYIQAIRKMDYEKVTTINEYILKFRELAIRKNFAGILVSQVNREAMADHDKRPKLWQLKFSGTLEEHAGLVLLTHWDYNYNTLSPRNDFEIIIAKHRDGHAGLVPVKFYPEYSMFDNWLPNLKKEELHEKN